MYIDSTAWLVINIAFKIKLFVGRQETAANQWCKNTTTLETGLYSVGRRVNLDIRLPGWVFFFLNIINLYYGSALIHWAWMQSCCYKAAFDPSGLSMGRCISLVFDCYSLTMISKVGYREQKVWLFICFYVIKNYNIAIHINAQVVLFWKINRVLYAFLFITLHLVLICSVLGSD